jgi:S1-C subfamily serine protease
MKDLTIILHATLALFLGNLCSFNLVYAGEHSFETSYLGKAEGCTVKIRTRVKYPPMRDNKGSHSSAGFLIDAERGWIATNAHVSSRNPESVEIAFKDQSFVDAKLLFVDRYLDLAILEAPRKNPG